MTAEGLKRWYDGFRVAAHRPSSEPMAAPIILNVSERVSKAAATGLRRLNRCGFGLDTLEFLRIV